MKNKNEIKKTEYVLEHPIRKSEVV